MSISELILLISSKVVKNLQASILLHAHKYHIFKDKPSTEQHPIDDSRKDRDFGPVGRWQDKHKVTEREIKKLSENIFNI